MRAEMANSPAPIRWNRNFVLILPVLLALMLGLFAVSATPQTKYSVAASSSASTTKSATNLNALVRDILQNELQAQAEDRSLWCYRKLTDKDGKQQSFAA
jgi:Flp pilus assembly protein TadG